MNGDDFAHDEGTDGSGVFGVRTMMMADLTLLVIFVGGETGEEIYVVCVYFACPGGPNSLDTPPTVT